MLNNSPYFRQPASVRSVMLRVLAALLPAIAAYIHFFGYAILVQLALASAAALAGEALLLRLRKKPVWLFVSDGSALVTAWLIALTFPPIVPWWLTVAAALFAIVVVKHLYGGLGQNPFNPAMAAFALMIVAYPLLMSQWPGAGFTDFHAQLGLIFGQRQLDAVTMATPLDALRTALHSAETPTTVAAALAGSPGFGSLGGKGWEWVAAGYLLGGAWLLQQRIITWHMPAAFLAALSLTAGVFHLYNPDQFAAPLFHLFSGGTLLAAFFIVTDPVSGATTPRGKLIFAAGIGLLTWVIRTFGAYPDGIAFAVLLANICVPLIDMSTQPPVFGHKQGEGK
ncbi:electron transport complex subunit RsxD [Denitratisoma sp. DHT3]|uniref:RnfABCDGE type electron transport complex subunit D n=1 Tax=Denitratisoma sp. DHT3 TaxID=1981880 RepID=UPI001198AB39|nr:RnfABCDGE type electron transport complex subunit D [Denitratisoma sp. DHT3]QDX80364.1 electron transport complex subunit RsxD [Denitratisoma sp. DHT3]